MSEPIPNKEYIIYCATNKVNGKSYIGQTSEGLAERKRKHVWNAKSGRHDKVHAFQNAINKYGEDAFEWHTMIVCATLEEANRAEEEFIAKFNTLSPGGYNLQKGGDNKDIADEVKEKIREKLKVVGSFVGKRGKDHPNFGRHPTQAQKDAQSAKLSGENAPLAKLTAKDARSIYEEYLVGVSVPILTKKYGLNSKNTVINLLNKRTWKAVNADLPNVDTKRGNMGSALPQSKLTEAQALEIIEKAKRMPDTNNGWIKTHSGSIRQKGNSKYDILAKEYGVGAHLIYQIVSGRLWKHLPR